MKRSLCCLAVVLMFAFAIAEASQVTTRPPAPARIGAPPVSAPPSTGLSSSGAVAARNVRRPPKNSERLMKMLEGLDLLLCAQSSKKAGEYSQVVGCKPMMEPGYFSLLLGSAIFRRDLAYEVSRDGPTALNRALYVIKAASEEAAPASKRDEAHTIVSQVYRADFENVAKMLIEEKKGLIAASKFFSMVKEEMQKRDPGVIDIEVLGLFKSSNVILKELLAFDDDGETAAPYYASIVAYFKGYDPNDLLAANSVLGKAIKDLSDQTLRELAYLTVIVEDIKTWIIIDTMPIKDYLRAMELPLLPDALVSYMAEEVAKQANAQLKEIMNAMRSAGAASASGGSVLMGASAGGSSMSSMAACLNDIKGSAVSMGKSPGGGVTDPVSGKFGIAHPFDSDPTPEKFLRDFAKSQGWSGSGGYGSTFGSCGALDPSKVKGGYAGQEGDLAVDEYGFNYQDYLGLLDILRDAIDKATFDVRSARVDYEQEEDYYYAEKDAGRSPSPRLLDKYQDVYKQSVDKLKELQDQANELRAKVKELRKDQDSGEFQPLQGDGSSGGCGSIMAVAACLFSGGGAEPDCMGSFLMGPVSTPTGEVKCGSRTGFPVILNNYIIDPAPYISKGDVLKGSRVGSEPASSVKEASPVNQQRIKSVPQQIK